MRRITQAHSPAIERAFEVIGPRLADRLRHVDFFCGTDPIWAGLHSFQKTVGGNSYGAVAHCCFRNHTSDKSVTVVLPVLVPPSTVVHELGHALHYEYALDHVALPVTDYAKTDRFEAFAEAFEATFFWYGDQDVWWSDEATRDLIQRLAS